MKFVDYYQVLGVSEHASEDEIKKAYRKLARKYHPDVSQEPQAAKKFNEATEAFEVLKDPPKRAEFDQLRKFGRRDGQEFEPPPDFRRGAWRTRSGSSATEVDPSEFSEFFSQIFGGRGNPFGGPFGTEGGVEYRASSRGIPGEDHTYEVEVQLEEAYSGGQRSLSLQSMEVDAEGRVVPKTRTLTVKIPAGVTDGQKIRLKGQGSPGRRGGPAGDLYLQIAIAPHKIFTVDGRDITLKLPVAPWEAVLGATVEAPTLGGDIKLTVPPGSQSGQRLRLKGRGLPGTPPGDQLVELEVRVPSQLTAQQRALFESLRDGIAYDPRAQLKAS